MNMPPASPRRFQARSSRLGAWASAGLIAVAAYVCIGTSCAPEIWDTAVETQISFDTHASVPMRLEADVSGVVREITIRTTPAAVVGSVVSVTLVSGDAGSALSSTAELISGAAPSGTTVSLAAPITSTPPLGGVASSLLPAASGSAQATSLELKVKTQPDGSVIVACGNSNCRALEFVVTPTSAQAAAPPSVRVHAEISGTTDNCGETAPSALRVELKDLTR